MTKRTFCDAIEDYHFCMKERLDTAGNQGSRHNLSAVADSLDLEHRADRRSTSS